MRTIYAITSNIILYALATILVTGCGKGGSSSGGSPTAPADPSTPGGPGCKAVNSVWQSDTNSERHDFTNLNVNYQAYTFVGYNGVNCNSQTAKLYAATPVPASYGFQYQIEMVNNNPAIGCDYWEDGTQHTHASGLLMLSCTKLTICRAVNDPNNCKTFH